jgi:hypothetical protein
MKSRTHNYRKRTKRNGYSRKPTAKQEIIGKQNNTFYFETSNSMQKVSRYLTNKHMKVDRIITDKRK